MAGHTSSDPLPGEYWTINFLVRPLHGSEPLTLEPGKLEVSLSQHTRGPGAGNFNCRGGKGMLPEPAPWTMQREEYAESSVLPLRWSHAGVLNMGYNGSVIPAHLFLIYEFLGEPRASEEMTNPTWFRGDQLPYERMWDGDGLWFPLVLSGYTIEGTVLNKDGKLDREPEIYITGRI